MKPEHRESETYLARYTSLLLRALNLFESQLKKDLEDRLEDIRKRRAEGSLNATTLHALLYRTMSAEMQDNLRFIGAWATEIPEYDNHLGSSSRGSSLSMPSSPSKAPGLLRSPSPATAVAKAQLKSTIRGISNWRQALLSPIVQELIDALNGAIEKKEDAMKASRTCIKGALDVCKEELTYFHRFFPPDVWSIQQQSNPLADYTVYLGDLCKQVTEVVSQIVGRTDLQDAVALTNWVERCYVPDFSQYNTEQESIDTQLFETNRRNITMKMSRDIKEVILGRFAEIVLRKIEKYEPTQQDLEIAPPYIDRRESLSGTKASTPGTRKIPNMDLDDLDNRAIEIIGEGYLTAYPPVKSATRMLILHNEMFPASSDDEFSNAFVSASDVRSSLSIDNLFLSSYKLIRVLECRKISLRHYSPYRRRCSDCNGQNLSSGNSSHHAPSG